MPLRSLHDVPAPAKLNLFLHVVGRRADGYHLLQSAFVLLDWCDVLHFDRRDDGVLVRRDLGPALPADDLCLRAARALRAASGTTLGADIAIEKRLPSGAGLGGGSSDAATTLLALNRLWDLHWPRARLQRIAERLGADVPFFVGGEHAIVEGIGERLSRLDWPASWFAVVKPSAALSTAAIFGSDRVPHEGAVAIIPPFLSDASHPQGGFGRNDLQPAAEAVCPEVSAVARWLGERFGNSRMSGSGSAVFARAGTGERPSATFDPAALPSGWVGRICRSREAHPLVGWALG